MKTKKGFNMAEITVVLSLLLALGLILVPKGIGYYEKIGQNAAKSNVRACYSQIATLANANEKNLDSSNIIIDDNCLFTGFFDGEFYDGVNFNQEILNTAKAKSFSMTDLDKATLAYVKDGKNFTAEFKVKTAAYNFSD